jgi:hypothetical protein
LEKQDSRRMDLIKVRLGENTKGCDFDRSPGSGASPRMRCG